MTFSHGGSTSERLFGFLKIFFLGGGQLGFDSVGVVALGWAQTGSPGPAGWGELAGVTEAGPGVCRMGWVQGEAPQPGRGVVLGLLRVSLLRTQS